MAKTKLVGDAAVAELAKNQHGLVTRAQAKAAKISSSGIDRRLANGAWEPVYARVYRLSGSPETEWQKVLSVCLHGGEGAVASHRTAAWLWKLDGFLDKPPSKVEVSASRDRRIDLKGVELFRRREDLDYTIKEGIPTTVLTQTLCDLAGQLKEDALEIALDSAGRGKPEFLEEMAEFLGAQKGHGRKGYGLLGSLVQRRRGGSATGSKFETKVLRAIRAAKLPAPSTQHPVFDGDDHPFAHVDFAWPDQKVALLSDGVGVHKSKRQFEKDAVQRARLTALGWRWVNVTPDLVKEGTWLKAIAKLLAASKPGAKKR
jgi:very-short-patch-repair endonuclease